MVILQWTLIVVVCFTKATSHLLTVPVNRLDHSLSMREQVADHYWPSAIPLKFKDDALASVCVGQSLQTRYSQEQWSLQMWDSSGTSITGTRAGAHQARGHPGLCAKVYKESSGTLYQELDSLIRRPHSLNEILDGFHPIALNITAPPIIGRFCTVAIRSKNDAAMYSSGSSELLATLSNHKTPSYATCVPDTCSEDLLQAWFQKMEGKHSQVHVKCTTSMTVFSPNNNPEALAYFVQPRVRDTSDVRYNFSSSVQSNGTKSLFTKIETKNVTIGTILFCVFACIIVTLALAATAVDHFLHSTEEQGRLARTVTQSSYQQTETSPPIYGWGFLQCFSLTKNWEIIFPMKPISGSIPVLDGMRCLCMCWVIIAHRYMFMLVTSSHPNDLLQLRENPNYWWLFNPYPSVDVFFVIAGFLLALSPVPKVSFNSIITTYIIRYLRLAPSVIVTVWGVSSVLGHLGAGPIWDSLHSGFFGSTCEKSWLSSILLMSNIHHPNDMCMGHLWSLSVDWQLSVVCVLVLVPLHQSGSVWRRYTPLASLTLAALIAPGVVSYRYALPLLPSMATLKYSLDFYNYYYVNTICRAAPYCLGVLGGRLHLWLKDNPEHLSGRVLRLGRPISLFMVSAVMITPLLVTRSSLTLSIIHNTIAKPCFAIAILFLIITSCHGKGGLAGYLLSRPAVGILARCSYCVYLISLPIQVWSSATNATLPTDGIIQLYVCIGDLILSIIGGICLSLLVEMPCARLLGNWIKKGKRQGQRKLTQKDLKSSVVNESSESSSSSDMNTSLSETSAEDEMNAIRQRKAAELSNEEQ